MPQLDPNSFYYQYFGVIILMTVIYTILSFLVLPIFLRFLIIRNYFIKILNLATNTISSSNKQIQKFLIIKNKSLITLFFNTSQFLNNLVVSLLNLVNTKNNLLDNKNNNNLSNVEISLVGGIYFLYLNFLLILDNNEE